MAQDILITPQAATPTIAYTGNGVGAATITQKVLGTSIIQFDDGGAVLFEMDPVANTVSALNLETNDLTVGLVDATTVSATNLYGAFNGNGSGLTGVVAEWDGSHTGNASINGNLDITGVLSVTGNSVLDAVTSTGLTVQGAAAVTGTLNVTGNTTLAAVTGTNMRANGTMTVTGTTTLAAVTATNTQVNGTLTVTGNTTLAAVTGTNMRANGTLTVTGSTTLAAVTGTNATFDAIVGDSLTVTGNVSAAAFFGDGAGLTNIAAGTIDHGSISGLGDDDHTQYIFNAPTNATRNVITAGASYQALTLKAAAVPVANTPMFVIETNAGTDKFVVDIDGDVTGAAATFNSAAVTGTLNVTGNTTLAAVTGTNIRANGTMQVTGTLNVTGNTTLAAVTGNTLNVTGNTTLAAVTATNTQVNGTLTVTGNTTLAAVTGTNIRANGTMQVTGTLNVTGNTTLAAVTATNTQVNGTLTVTGNTTLAAVTGTNMRANGTMTVTGTTTLAAVTATNTQVNGTLTVTGTTTLAAVTATNVDFTGNMSGTGDINIVGDLKANSKSFLIDHPSADKVGWKLQHTCLEGPENGVYARGRANSLVVDLPHYWPDLVHEETITVHLTPIGLSHPIVRVSDVKDNKIFVEGAGPDDLVDFFYIAYATRKDIPMLVVEHAPEGDA